MGKSAGSRIELLPPAVDWLTATCSREESRDKFFDLAKSICSYAERDGSRATEWGGHGYRGQRAGFAAYGRRPEDDLITISGPEADQAFADVVKLATSFSRIDTHVTARFEPARPKLAYDAFTAWKRANRGRGRPRLGNLLLGEPDGQTLYVGSPKSDTRVRLYDKHAESKDEAYHACWRWEVQARRKVAVAVADRLSRVEDRASAIESLVRAHFGRLGIEPPWGTGGTAMPISIGRTASDVDRRLTWLREQVLPAIQWLVSQGRGDQVIEALKIHGLLKDRDRQAQP